MKDDDPEKRIRELERELADVTRGTQKPPPASAPPTGFGAPSYGAGYTQPRRRPALPWYTVVILAATVLSILTGVAALVRVMVQSGGLLTPVRNGGTTVNGPTAVPQGGELRLNDNNATRTVACNDGKLTLSGFHDNYTVTGHCASLTVGGYSNNVTLDSADTLESTGYSNTLTDHACNNATVKLSSYGIIFNGTGHCTGLAITSYDNKAIIDSVDTVTVSGYNNDVTYHQGTPKVTDSGYDNNIHQG